MHNCTWLPPRLSELPVLQEEMRSDIGQKPLHQWDGHEVRSQSVVESGISVPIYTSFIYVNTSNIKKTGRPDWHCKKIRNDRLWPIRVNPTS